jgi:hypothetical protein
MTLFDIFRMLKGGNLRWKKTVETMESARSQVKILQDSSPGRYIIISHRTGERVVVPQAEDSRSASVVRMKCSKSPGPKNM